MIINKCPQNKPDDRIKCYAKQQGLSFIEVMVTLVVFGIGLIGAISLQVRGLDAGQRAIFSTEAQLLAQDMADRILAYGTNGADGGEYAGINTSVTTALPACSAGGCTTSQTLQKDKAEWEDQFDNFSLSGGIGLVTWADPVYTIEIRWNRYQDTNAVTTCSAAHVACFKMEVRL